MYFISPPPVSPSSLTSLSTQLYALSPFPQPLITTKTKQIPQKHKMKNQNKDTKEKKKAEQNKMKQKPHKTNRVYFVLASFSWGWSWEGHHSGPEGHTGKGECGTGLRETLLNHSEKVSKPFLTWSLVRLPGLPSHSSHLSLLSG